jgi:hypothetical protein
LPSRVGTDWASAEAKGSGAKIATTAEAITAEVKRFKGLGMRFGP